MIVLVDGASFCIRSTRPGPRWATDAATDAPSCARIHICAGPCICRHFCLISTSVIKRFSSARFTLHKHFRVYTSSSHLVLTSPRVHTFSFIQQSQTHNLTFTLHSGHHPHGATPLGGLHRAAGFTQPWMANIQRSLPLLGASTT
uniref:Uncharacterized protein n=1 Tax=Strigamia maritima TaxID=126957 RepID=T1IH07_STRMM